MGLLDDAIREHLELKRKHGAPDAEIERAEQEALTPARRDPTADSGASVEGVEGVQIDPDDVPPPPPPPPPVDDPVYADEYAVDPPPADPDAPEPALPFSSEEDEDDLALPPEPSAQETQVRSVIEPPGAVSASSLEREAEEAPPPGTAKPHGDPAIEDDDLDAEELEPDEVPSEEQLGGGEQPDPYRSRTTILDDPLDESAPPSPAHPPPAGEAAAADEPDVLEQTPDFLRETPEHDKLWFEQKPPRDFDFD